MLVSVVASLFFSLLLQSVTLVSGLGSSCSAPLGPGTAGPNDPYWQQNIQHQGTSAFGPGGYQVFRNVKDFGAKGDGVTDDTAAINAAISQGGRCGNGCGSSSTTPATVFFPQGTYLVSTPIQAYYYTELVGDARHPPTLLGTANFAGIAIIDGDPGWYGDTNNFYRSIRNFVIDTTRIPATNTGTGIHWQVAQATSLYNIVFNLNANSNTAHQGIWMENGSGGFMGDLVFNGGSFGMWVGNQQFTVRNITVNNAKTGVYNLWGWGWTFQGVTLNNCQVGFDLATGGKTSENQGSEAVSIIDAVVTNTPVFVRSSKASTGTLTGSIVLNNIKLNNVPTAVGVVGGAVVLNGGSTTINSWAQGNVYTGTNTNGRFVQDNIANIPKAGVLLDSGGRIVSKGRPAYTDYAVSQFVSVKSQGARGDGNTDDTAALQAVFDKYSGCKIIYFDAGTYIVSSTLTIPAGTQIVGEAWSNIMGSGSAFTNTNSPQPVVKVGTTGSTGIAEISGILFTTRAPANGAIAVEWNIHDPSGQQAAAGTWDTLIRLGGAAGTNIQGGQCSNGTTHTGDTSCFASHTGIHITSGASGYFEGLWVWLADHDVDGGAQITAYSGRGIHSESQGPVWMIGTASEHHTLYQYGLINANNHYLGLIQTETPYYQPNPAAPAPWTPSSTYNDPTAFGGGDAWSVYVKNSNNILVYGAGLYSFFNSYNGACVNTFNCQNQIIDVDSASSVSFYSVSTVGIVEQLSVNEQGIVPQSANGNGFAQTFTAWTRS
ncbi:beta-1,3-glucanase [Dentipellis sp. KUC8613]|nr:beta-1,3-glucanase [Dentipellis sp. KUC8613]